MMHEMCLSYFRQFLSSVPGDVTLFASCKKELILPTIPLSFVNQLVEHVTELLKYEQSLLTLKAPITVVGDLHGHLLDLFRILKTCGSPEARQYLFLGDIVDRGEFSVETILLIYIMKACWPKNVYIIRGNHEFGFLCGQCGFFAQLSVVYGDANIFKLFLRSFSYLPLGALIDNNILCIHGGLSPDLLSISQIRNIHRPFDNFGTDPVIDGILWSDPSKDVTCFVTSPRGSGYLFGEDNTKKFLKNNHLKYIIRGHECVQEGFDILFDSIITVFSASNYCGMVKNDAAFLNIKKDGTFEKKTLPTMDYLLRNFTFFRKEKPKQKTKTVKEPASARVVAPKPHVIVPRAKGQTPRFAPIVKPNKSYNTPILRRMRF